MTDVRVYLVIDAGANRTPAQWNQVLSEARLQPMIERIIELATADNLPQRHININRQSINGANYRYMLGDFEIGDLNVTAANTFVNNQLTANGLSTTGSQQVRFTRLLQFEIRAAAVAAGFTQVQANLITVTTIGFGAMLTAIADAQAVIDANSAIWNPAE